MTTLRVLAPAPWLVGQGRAFPTQQVDTGPMLLWLGMAAAAITAISVAAYFAHRAAVRRRLSSHPGLFDALCKLHALDRGQRTLLWQVARARNLPYPGQVFTEPNQMNPKTLPAALQARAPELGKLHRQLFG